MRKRNFTKTSKGRARGGTRGGTRGGIRGGIRDGIRDGTQIYADLRMSTHVFT